MKHNSKNVKLISVVNQKGGVGKTTTVLNVSTALAIESYRVLVVDFDPQGNLSSGMGIENNIKKNRTIYDVLTNKVDIKKALIKTKVENIDILASNVDLAAFEIEIRDFKNRERYLINALDTIKNNYDYILMDCPPSLGFLTINSLTASDYVLIPLQCEFFALEGLVNLLGTINKIKDNFNEKLKILGILLTMYDKRNKLTEQIERDVRNSLGDSVYETVIPRNIKLTESTSFGIPSIIYDQSCSGSVAYINFVKEMVKRNG